MEIGYWYTNGYMNDNQDTTSLAHFKCIPIDVPFCGFAQKTE